MGRVFALALIGSAVLAACSDNGGTREIPEDTNATSFAYGWNRPVRAATFPDASEKLGGASSAIDGHTLENIVQNAKVRVRGDDKSCVTCHSWATDISREAFCTMVPKFIALPTSKGDGHDDISAKPLVLKDLLDRWHAAGCPE